MRVALFLLLPLFVFTYCKAQTENKPVITDTLALGYYPPLDSNMVSCKIMVIFPDGLVEKFDHKGNLVSAGSTYFFTHCEIGTRIYFTEITVMENGTLYKRPSEGYFIGTKNTNPKAVLPKGVKGG